ncbi:MAG TPA: DUF2341 domain-containing protein [Candidatus Thermoplasmatota archaeon]|nr:DUF2341 domain-containing protein [Candidatus Thermoplasmatota archaeon]
MKKSQINVFLAAGAVTLFLLSSCASGIVSTFQSTTTDTSQQKNAVTNDNAVITCYVSGIPYTQTMSSESGLYFKELFSALALANAHDPCSTETKQLQKKILQYAEQQGLLPVGMSAEMVLAQLWKRSQSFVTRGSGSSVHTAGIGREMFCNFVATGEGAAFPIIILPRFIPFIMTPIPRLFVGWKTPIGVTSVGGLVSRTGFYAVGPQQGFALGFWGIGFSIFLPPVMAYGMFGYALYAKVSAEYMEYFPPNHSPEITAMYPLDGATYIPLSTSELRFHISDYDSDLMSYSVTTYPDVGGGNGNMKPDGTYTVPISGLKSATEYTWFVTVSDGMDTVEEEFTFTTEAVSPAVSDVLPVDGDRYVPVSQGFLRFHLRDPQNDLMSYTVETSPFIGSGSGSGVSEGDISVPISGLDVMTEYRWFVNVTDGVNPTSEAFWFRTEPLMVFDPFTEGWEYRKMITVNHTMVAGELEYFPVLLDITDTDLRDKAQDDGDDILFMNGAGVAIRLYHEIEEFDSSTGRLIAWVNISSLSSTVDTSFYLYYGNMGSSNQQCPDKTWDSDFALVQHFNERSGTLFDSTGYSNDGIPYGGVMQDAVGKIGNADRFDGENDYVSMGDVLSFERTNSFSASAWIYLDTSGDAERTIMGKYYSKGWILYHYDNRLYVNLYSSGNSRILIDTTNQVLTTGAWYYVSFTYTGTSTADGVKIYFNGGSVPLNVLYNTLSSTIVGAEPLCFGASGTVSSKRWFLDGTIDEERISSCTRSADWILTEYLNQEDPSAFFNVGFEEPGP